jgi:[acyl-carrier-protein] S-malonyltransferase
MDLAQRRGAVGTVPLEVSGAFHSVLMEPVVEGMKQAISQVDFRSPDSPIVANSTAIPVNTVEEIKDELIRQLCSCVRWQSSVEYMAGAGVFTFVEIGPGNVLTKLIKRTSRESRALNMSDPDAIRALAD